MDCETSSIVDRRRMLSILELVSLRLAWRMNNAGGYAVNKRTELTGIDLPDFGVPKEEPSLPAAAAASSRIRITY